MGQMQGNISELITTHGDSPQSVNKLTKSPCNNKTDIASCSWQLSGRTPLRKFFLVKVNAYHCTIIFTLNWAEELIMPPVGLPNLGLIKKHNAKYWHYQEELPKRRTSSELLGATEDLYLL